MIDQKTLFLTEKKNTHLKKENKKNYFSFPTALDLVSEIGEKSILYLRMNINKSIKEINEEGFLKGVEGEIEFKKGSYSPSLILKKTLFKRTIGK